MSYVKLFSDILDSTIWQESKETRLVWITMLAKAGADGIVLSSIPGLAKDAGVSVDECIESLKVLMSPDPFSRTKDKEGRRIEEVEGGWLIINHAKYRARQDSRAEYYRKYRATVAQQRRNNAQQRATQAEAEAEADTKTKAKTDRKSQRLFSGELTVKPTEQPFSVTDKFIEHWNSFDNLPRVRALSKGRRAKLLSRMKEKSFRENWKEIVRKLSESAFHTGQNDRGWRASIDWIIKNDENYLKILELPCLMDGATREIDEDELDLILGVKK
mgnify:CR=1 FL=1